MSLYEIVNGRLEVRGYTQLFERRYSEDQPRDDKGRFTPTGAQVLDTFGPTGKEGENDTKNEYFDKSTGQYEADRQSLHDATVAKEIGNAQAPVGRAPVAVIMGGGTSSGKTSASREILGENKNMVRIDPDEVKTHIPEYQGFKEIDPMNAAGRVHAESSDVTKQVLTATINGGYDLCYDTTTSNSTKTGANIDRLSAAGYKTDALFIDIPVETAIERADIRARTSDDPINRGRFVPESNIRENHAASARVFLDTIKDNPSVGLKQVYDNSQPKGQPPTLVYERQGMGEEKIVNAEKWAAYVAKADYKGKRMTKQQIKDYIAEHGGFCDPTDGDMDDVTEPNGSDEEPYPTK